MSQQTLALSIFLTSGSRDTKLESLFDYKSLIESSRVLKHIPMGDQNLWLFRKAARIP